MISVLAGILMQAGVASYATMPGVDSLSRDPLVDSLRAAETQFLLRWRREWMTGRRSRVSYGRLASLHCHYDGSWQSGAPNIIRSKESTRSFCPVWYPVDDSMPSDEANGVDASLTTEEGRKTMRRARANLIARFAAAVAEKPSDPFLIGQLVRLAVDQKESAMALGAARSCGASRPWCLLLEGYVHQADGRDAAADSVFTRAIAAMKPAERCEWSSIAPVLDQRARSAYERIPCAARDSINATYWWLADPMYMEPGNARRAAHFARLVLVRLHAALTMDERWDWRQKYGGDALAAMIVRYGWPSHMYWAGFREDHGHFEWLGFADSAINVAPEYALPRFHTSPPWRAVLDPATLSTDDWSLFAPRQGYGSVVWESDVWPTDHWSRPLGPVVNLAEQTVMLRRDNDALLAIGLDVPQKFFTPGAPMPYDAAVVVARDPNERWMPSRESILLDGRGTTVLTSPLSARAQIVSAELAPADGAPGLAVRSRRAIHPPPPLSVMQAGEVGISDPLFFRPGDDAAPPSNAQDAIAKMLGSLSFTEKRIGVFWETYGVAPSDTVELTLRLVSTDKPGLFRRLGTKLGVVETIGGEMAMSWREPRIGMVEGLTWAGDVPIQARGVVLDISRLKAGRYAVEISAVKRGSIRATTRREINVR
jgi:hypothetical protein